MAVQVADALFKRVPGIYDTSSERARKDGTTSMFGHNWEPGQATIVAAKQLSTVPPDPLTGQDRNSYEYVADVLRASGGPMFRTVLSEPFDIPVWLNASIVGSTVPVKCDPKRERAKFDTAAVAARNKAQREAVKDARNAQFDAMVDAAPGTSSSLGGAIGGRSLADILQQAATDPEGLRERLRAQAPGSGASAFAVTPDGLTPLGTPTRQPSTDVADTLSKLADLHDRGALTDEEFAAEKAKILGES